jgi:uncharacterized membrane protein
MPPPALLTRALGANWQNSAVLLSREEWRNGPVSAQQIWLRQLGAGVAEIEQTVLDTVRKIPHFRHDHPPVSNVNDQMRDSFTPLERVALAITLRVGSFGFFLIILAWSILWLGWNTLAPRALRFDPAPAFVLWLFISNMIQITLMPLIMVGQNLLNRHSELRAEEDFKINMKAEHETAAVLLHLEHQGAQIERQGELILQILRRLEESEKQGQATRRLILAAVTDREPEQPPASSAADGTGDGKARE